MPRRSPPPPPSTSVSIRNSPPRPVNTCGGGGQLGAFWGTDYAKESNVTDNSCKPKFDEEPIIPKWDAFPQNNTIPNVQLQEDRLSKKEFETKHFSIEKSGREEELEVEVEKLKKQLKQAIADKDEIQSKFEKLSAICRSQRQELQDLKHELATRTPSPNPTDSSKDEISPPQIEGTVWELEKGLVQNSSPSPEPKSWKPVKEAAKLPAPTSTNSNNISKSVRTRHDNNAQNNNAKSGGDSWGFGTESAFTAFPGGPPNLSKQHINNDGNNFHRSSESKKPESSLSASQPAGWAGF